MCSVDVLVRIGGELEALQHEVSDEVKGTLHVKLEELQPEEIRQGAGHSASEKLQKESDRE